MLIHNARNVTENRFVSEQSLPGRENIFYFIESNQYQDEINLIIRQSSDFCANCEAINSANFHVRVKKGVVDVKYFNNSHDNKLITKNLYFGQRCMFHK